MSNSVVAELLDVPRDFLREGNILINRCQKPDKREFLKISQAVGVGFVVMGMIGYVVKLTLCITLTALTSTTIVHIPVNNILVGGA